MTQGKIWRISKQWSRFSQSPTMINKSINMKKYDIYNIDLNPKKWSAQAWIRPCVIIQSNIFNNHSPTLIIVPLTSNDKKIFPSEFLIKPSKQNWLKQESRFLWSQIITIDKRYFWKKLGKLDECYFEEMHEALSTSLDWCNDY